MKKEKISVVIPVGKEKEILAIDSLKKQRPKVQIIIQRGPNPSLNRNLGSKKAKGNFIAFINAHTIVSDEWSKKILDFYEKYPEIDVVGGPQLTNEEEGLFPRISGYAFQSKFGSASVQNRYKPGKFNFDADELSLTSANLICKKKVLKKVKFREDLYPGEDPAFISDVKKAGFRIAYNPELRVYNLRRNSIGSLIKQIFNYGRLRPKKEKIQQTLKHPIFIVPSIFLLYLFFLPSLLFLSKYSILPLFIYVVSNLIFTLSESIKNRSLSALFLLPPIFLAIHLSYGFGFLIGFIESLIFKKKIY